MILAWHMRGNCRGGYERLAEVTAGWGRTRSAGRHRFVLGWDGGRRGKMRYHPAFVGHRICAEPQARLWLRTRIRMRRTRHLPDACQSSPPPQRARSAPTRAVTSPTARYPPLAIFPPHVPWQDISSRQRLNDRERIPQLQFSIWKLSQ